MSATDWAMGLVAVVVAAGILYFIFTQPITGHVQEGPPSVSIEGPPTGYAGQSLVYSVRMANHAGEEVSVTSDAGANSYPCAQDLCVFPITLSFTEAGEHVIHVQVGGQYDEIAVTIKTKAAVCVDGTAEGVCSSPPLKCVGQSLIPDCDSCGCPSGEVCVDHACSAPDLSFTLALSELSTFYTTGVATIPFSLTNTSVFPADGLFVGRLIWYDSSKKQLGEKSQQYLLDDLAPNGSDSLTIETVFPIEAKYVSLEWFANGSTYDSTTVLAQSDTLKPISVTEDKSPPLPPSNLSYHEVSDGIELTWSGSSSNDVKSYVVYQQSSATGGFTTYAVAGEVSGLTFTVSGISGDTAFSITAKDGAGNESQPAEPIVVSGP